ncbi:PA domain-containing protein [uncultured Algibacter sp.]|uniref:PA domain-containing protein n=1 Tax=uncultured Algibacter sp. TaxID=298659 RepID=UPI002638D84F|nr:PA domain-containing protein [uncultured Algibacter sp.]
MKKKVLVYLILLVAIGFGCFEIFTLQSESDKITDLRKQHEYFLSNSPFSETLKLTKEDRKQKGIPPNKYLEREWELTMNPLTGKPEYEKLLKLQEQLRNNKVFSKVPGEKDNDWYERGPNNVGGRTRAIMFDPNDNTNNRVFAGGVSGGLWVNNDITNASSDWAEVNIPQNLSITCITYDPNALNTFYLGTGESYVGGDVQGNGVWRSTDGGANWTRVFGGVSGETTFESSAKLTVNSPLSIAGEYQVTTAAFGPALTMISGDLVLVDDGSGAPERGCNPLVNGGAASGKIAVVERGDCNFTIKVKNAQDEGAIAVLVVNNNAGTPIALGGEDATIIIPSVMISRDEGQAIIAQLGAGANVTIEPVSSPVLGNHVTPGIQHINDIKIRDLGATSEVYVAAGANFYADANPLSFFGIEDFGLYKSTNSGTSWSQVSLPTPPGGAFYEPNDIEIASDNIIWLATKGNLYGTGGGAILSSSDGISFSLEKTITNGERTQIAVSSANANTVYVLGEVTIVDEGTGQLIAPFLYMSKTTDGFTNETSLTLPDDADTGISADDFTRGQAFYDLMLEVDPTNDAILYVGGIDLFRSSDSGANWSQISKWSNNNNLAALTVPEVHADQHAFVFHPTDKTKAVVGNDGGVYYATGLSSSPPVLDSRNVNYNTVQFYKGGIGQDVNNIKILGGSQDNGVLYEEAATNGLNSFDDINNGGDGAYVFVDEDDDFVIASFVYNTYTRRSYADGSLEYNIDSDQTSGNFINPSALDSDTNYLYSNGTLINTATYQINRYKLGMANATSQQISVAIMDGEPTAFKTSDFSGTLFVGTDNSKLFKLTNPTSNSNQGWTEITGDDFFGSISCIELGETEDDIYVSFHNYGVTNVFYSPDGGLNWENKEGNLPDLPVKAIMPNPLNYNEVILGTELGVWGTADFSTTSPNWVQAQNGMKDVKVTSFDLRTADNTVLASTYGRGMFTGQFTADPSTLSTLESNIEDLIKVYPTVSNGSFKIKASKQVSDGILNVYSINGRKVHNTILNFSNNRVQDITLNVSSGLYIIEVNSKGLKSTKKIIIK